MIYRDMNSMYSPESISYIKLWVDNTLNNEVEQEEDSVDNTPEGEPRILRRDSGDPTHNPETGGPNLENISGYRYNSDHRKTDGSAEETDNSGRIRCN